MEERKIADESNDLGSCGGDGEGKRRNGKSGLLSRLERVPLHGKKGNGIIFCHIHDPREKVRAKATIFSFRNSGRRLPPLLLLWLLPPPPPLTPLPRLFDIPFCHCVSACFNVCLFAGETRQLAQYSLITRRSALVDDGSLVKLCIFFFPFCQISFLLCTKPSSKQ
jgi:hypothetical protein